MEYEASDAGRWTNSPEQRAFRDQVLNAHLARSRSVKGAPQPDLSTSQLAPVRGTSISMRLEAAEAASRLLEAANADLKSAQAAGNQDALRTARITANSGYRGSDHQRRLWLRYFERYYDKTQQARATIPEGPHSAPAVSYMLTTFKLPNRIAAPGYSNHQGGIAIDFEQERGKPYQITNSYEAAEQRKWRASWFFDWVNRNAVRFGFKPYIKEAWHWEYRPNEVSARLPRSNGPAKEQEYESAPVARPFLGGFVHTFTSTSLGLVVSIFCPKTAMSRQSVDVLVYAHGLLSPCPPVPKNLPEDFITKGPFRLGEIVNASNRAAILVVPFFDWKPRQKHALGKPAHLNRLVDEVLATVAAIRGNTPLSLSKLILAGHSRAYDFLEPLANSYADPQMQQGALARLSEVWALDASYVCNVPAWLRWLNVNTNLRVSVLFRKAPRGGHSGTADCGWRFYSSMKASNGRLNVVPLDPRITHCGVPTSQLPRLLNAPDAADQPGRRQEGESMPQLNFEAESFGGQVEYFSPQVRHAGHGGLGHHHGRRNLFRRGFYRDWFGSAGGLTQDSQSTEWAQCLAQLTGVRGLHQGRSGHRMRRAIRRFQTQNQLPPTGRLDEDTTAALQEACGNQGDSDGSFDGQNEAGEVQYQHPPTVSAPHDAWEVWFEWNSTKLRQDNEVDSVIQLLAVVKQAFSHLQAKGSAAKIVLTGFASTEGGEAHNQNLSLQRAQRVKSLLVEADVPADRIQVIGGGPSKAWPGGLKWNRRVQIDFQP
jgi:outer membrane protein OmpA-like peptidoglycan-associated protein/LAS superfamily LD-carboxypeptidase LdcB